MKCNWSEISKSQEAVIVLNALPWPTKPAPQDVKKTFLFEVSGDLNYIAELQFAVTCW